LFGLGIIYKSLVTLREDRKGMIKKVYLADMVMYNNDLMTIPPEEIMKALVDYTIVGGKVVYQREGAN